MSVGPEAPINKPNSNPLDASSSLVSTQFATANHYASQSFTLAFDSIANIEDSLDDIAYETLINWLIAEIGTPSMGITAAIQQDIYDLETERDELALADAKLSKSRDWAKGAWPLGDGILEASLALFDREYLNRRLDKSREIRIATADKTIANTHFAIQRYTELVVADVAIKEKAAESIAQTAATLAAGALSAAHAQASVGFSSGYDVRHDTSSQINGNYTHYTSYDADSD